MSGPQLEDGYTRIANELLEAVTRANLSRRHYKVVLAVVRRTYGYGKKEAELSMSEIANMTGLDLGNTSKAVNDLVKMTTLSKRQVVGKQVLGLNKNYAKWQLVKTTRVVKTTSSACQNDKHIKKKEIPPSEDTPKAGVSASSKSGEPDTVWDFGKKLLAASGLDNREAGGLLGRLIKQYGEELVSQALAAASIERPAHLPPWLFGFCKQRATKKRKVAL